MRPPIRLTPEALRDVEEARAWYDLQRQGLGKEFVESVDQILLQIASHPRQYPAVLKGVRRALIRRFPYLVPFREESDRIVVLGVIHAARDPGLLRRRSRR